MYLNLNHQIPEGFLSSCDVVSYSINLPIFYGNRKSLCLFLMQGDLRSFLKRKGPLKPLTTVKFALDIARLLILSASEIEVYHALVYNSFLCVLVVCHLGDKRG